MNDILNKKLKLLAHLANIDDNFSESERQVMISLLKESGVNADVVASQMGPTSISDFDTIKEKTDVLYWALLLIKSDGQIHPDEAAYCKALAVKLNFKAEIVDYFVENELGDRGDFKKRISIFARASA